MFAARSLLRSSTMRVGRNMMARKISTAAPAPVGPIRAFFQDVPIPVDVYPLVGIVVVMCSGATYMLNKHIYEDRDHLRWAPQRGDVKFLLPSP
ncbi:hypothetical protein I308_106477 [Cryptococcus tetragattii IND107]|uniref:Uncharacterized protein n=1 Tax=Cryptococcus tetragattii IND107 TaxID=1296105 RepID=A0ABR3BJ13_9TREE|nr:hypothetical protein I308_05422 [Cryptococcus tetragattii IND107]